jgi:nitrate reductase gamma subunit
MAELIRGPLVWVALAVFGGGLLYQLVSRLALARRDKVVYAYWNARAGLRSVLHWVIPGGSRNMRRHPFFTLLSFSFHLCLLATPLLAAGHAVLWRRSLGMSWYSLPAGIVDVATLWVVAAGAVFLLRRAASPEVRNVTTSRDLLLVLLVVAPFLTGFLAHHQVLPYEAMLTLHILTGSAWLAMIPFTRLSHALWFVFTRSYMGSESGAVRHARDW